MKTIGLKHDSKTGARTVVENCATDNLRSTPFLPAIAIVETIAMLLTILPKLRTNILKLLFLEVETDSCAVGFFPVL